MQRTVIFGDIHGCDREWQALLDKIAPSAEDRLIAVGDLICKGPASRKTLERALALKNLTCILGNHEMRFLEYWRKKEVPGRKPYDEAAFRDMGKKHDSLMKAVAAWPLYVEDEDFIVVHAGLRPGIPLPKQTAVDLTTWRYLDEEKKTPWYEAYTDKKPVVFGHWPRETPLIRDNVFGIDTGCVHGGFLSALVLPERKIVQVKAKKAYYVRRTKE